jgi:Fe-S cluster assembly iron-binding protein IscA
MLTVTKAAGTRLAHYIERQQCRPAVAVRLTQDGRRIMTTVDEKRPGDTTFEHQGRTVLLLDERLAQLLADETLDIRQTDEGDRLTLRRAEAAS